MSDVVRYDTVTRAIKTVLQRAGDKGATFEQLTDYAWAHRSGYIKPAEDPTDLGPRVAKDLLCLHQDGEVTLCFFPQVTPKERGGLAPCSFPYPTNLAMNHSAWSSLRRSTGTIPRTQTSGRSIGWLH